MDIKNDEPSSNMRLISLVASEGEIEKHFELFVSLLREKAKRHKVTVLYSPTLKHPLNAFEALIKEADVSFALTVPILLQDALQDKNVMAIVKEAIFVREAAYMSWITYRSYMAYARDEAFQRYAAYKEMSRIDDEMIIAGYAGDFEKMALANPKDIVRMRIQEHAGKPFEVLVLEKSDIPLPYPMMGQYIYQ